MTTDPAFHAARATIASSETLRRDIDAGAYNEELVYHVLAEASAAGAVEIVVPPPFVAMKVGAGGWKVQRGGQVVARFALEHPGPKDAAVREADRLNRISRRLTDRN